MSELRGADWFKERIASTGLSARGVAEAMKMEPDRLSRSINRGRKFTLDEAFAFAVATGCTVEEIFIHVGGNLDLLRRVVRTRVSEMRSQRGAK